MKRLNVMAIVLLILCVLFYFSELQHAIGFGLGIFWGVISLISFPAGIWWKLARRRKSAENKAFDGVIVGLLGIGLVAYIGDFYARFGNPGPSILKTAYSVNIWTVVAVAACAIGISLLIVVFAFGLIWSFTEEQGHAKKDETSS